MRLFSISIVQGGEVAGCFDLADEIFACRGRKPIWAILSENAFSAAYAIASAADRITVPRTGGTGSVGVICLHVDFSKALATAGIAVTLITYGARKAEGNEYEPLSDGALERFQADIDRMGELFCETVARNRGLAVAQVRAMEAGTFLGAAGVDNGLADVVAAPDEAFRVSSPISARAVFQPFTNRSLHDGKIVCASRGSWPPSGRGAAGADRG